MTQSKDDINILLAAKPEELYAVLGAAALSIDQSPIGLLRAGRGGQLYAAGPPLLGEGVGVFDHEQLREAGKAFLRRWGKEIRKALCESPDLYATEKAQARKQVDVWIATLVASLTATIPALGAFTVVLNVIAVIVVHSGLSAFCGSASAEVAKDGPGK